MSLERDLVACGNGGRKGSLKSVAPFADKMTGLL